MTAPHYIGLMSGTSLDGIDAVLVEFSASGPAIIATHSQPISAALRADLLRLTQSGDHEIDRMGQVDVQFSLLQAAAVDALLRSAGVTASTVCAIGSHGQTLRHRPDFDTPFTLQIGDPNTLAEHCGIDVVADFRRRDMAAGGQGAPLVPAFHNALFHHPTRDRVILNVGGMANITWLPAASEQQVRGFDTGPGNVLLDSGAQLYLGEPYDRHGQWAASGRCHTALLDSLLGDEYFSAPPPKSTGRERFNWAWVHHHLELLPTIVQPADLQATLLELTAHSIADEIHRLGDQPEIYVCGGGAHNHTLLARLSALLPGYPVATTEALGLHPDWVEAIAFAWLAKRFIDRQPGNLPAVTGARGPRVLGCLYPA